MRSSKVMTKKFQKICFKWRVFQIEKFSLFERILISFARFWNLFLAFSDERFSIACSS